jgi:hypothetical protein
MMDESAVSFHMPETKQQLKQCTKKIKPGPIKAKVHVTRRKQMFLANDKGFICMNYVPRDKTVNANYIVETLSRFLKKVFKKKRPNMVARKWFFH